MRQLWRNDINQCLMRFRELAQITCKTEVALKKAFLRKRFSIRKAKDVQAYLYLALRPRQVRRPQPSRSAVHLQKYQFQRRVRPAAEIEFLAAPRKFGQIAASPKLQKLLSGIASEWLGGVRSLAGLIFTGGQVATGTGELLVLAVTLPGAPKSLPDKLRLAFAKTGEDLGVALKFQAVSAAALPSELLKNLELTKKLQKGRLEFGLIGLPI
jgi:hypothetical protein